MVVVRTATGYRGGEIIKDQGDGLRVMFTRDELGAKILEEGEVSVDSIVTPRKKTVEPLWLYTTPEKDGTLPGEGFVAAGMPFDQRLGSGVTGVFDLHRRHRKGFVKYPIYSGLTILNREELSALVVAFSTLALIVEERLTGEEFSETLLDRVRWLMNLCLYLDGQEFITKETIKLAVDYFCSDYKEFPPGTVLRQPINYLFDSVGLDGVWSKVGSCMSFIPTDFEGVSYKVVEG